MVRVPLVSSSGFLCSISAKETEANTFFSLAKVGELGGVPYEPEACPLFPAHDALEKENAERAEPMLIMEVGEELRRVTGGWWWWCEGVAGARALGGVARVEDELARAPPAEEEVCEEVAMLMVEECVEESLRSRPRRGW